MQSRSIDSYAHAIHRFQHFDTSGVDFSEPVESAPGYTRHIEHTLPYFTSAGVRVMPRGGQVQRARSVEVDAEPAVEVVHDERLVHCRR